MRTTALGPSGYVLAMSARETANVAVGVGSAVGVGTGVWVGTAVGEGPSVLIGVAADVGEGATVSVGTGVGVSTAVGGGPAVAEGLGVWVASGVAVGVLLGVRVGGGVDELVGSSAIAGVARWAGLHPASKLAAASKMNSRLEVLCRGLVPS